MTDLSWVHAYERKIAPVYPLDPTTYLPARDGKWSDDKRYLIGMNTGLPLSGTYLDDLRSIGKNTEYRPIVPLVIVNDPKGCEVMMKWTKATSRVLPVTWTAQTGDRLLRFYWTYDNHLNGVIRKHMTEPHAQTLEEFGMQILCCGDWVPLPSAETEATQTYLWRNRPTLENLCFADVAVFDFMNYVFPIIGIKEGSDRDEL